MEDTCEVYRITAKAELQPDGSMGTDTEVILYSGLCSFNPIIARRDRFDQFGEGLIYSVQYRLTLPWNADGIRITDLVRITSSRDGEGDDRRFEIRDIHRVTDISQRRFTLHDIDR
jgi:hypothetical protein